MQSRTSYLFEKNAKAVNRGTLSTAEKYPFVYGSAGQPSQWTNIKSSSKTYANKSIPADHDKPVFSKESVKARLEANKIESQMRIERDRKFSNNRMKAIATTDFQQYK